MTRTFDPVENPILKTPWSALPAPAHSRRIGRIRDVSLFSVDQGLTPVAQEIRWDFQRTDDWIEVAKLSTAYLQHLKDKAALTPTEGS